MRSFLPAIATALCALSLPLTSKAETFKVGSSFVGFSAPDQHGAAVTFKAGDAKFVMFDTPGESGSSQPPQDPGFFSKNHVFLVINISDLNTLKQKIARTRLRSKAFKLVVVDDKSAANRFPTEAGKLTVFILNDKGAITGIKFAVPGPELKKLITGS